MFDIRKPDVNKIDRIRFAEDDEEIRASILVKSEDGPYLEISNDSYENMVPVASEEDAKNLIEALHYAIDLGWFND